MKAARYLAMVVGKAHARQMDAVTPRRLPMLWNVRSMPAFAT